MQEEVTQKTIALSMKTGKLTAQVLQAALKKYLQHRAKGKTTLHHGQQSLKQLKKHGAALSSFIFVHIPFKRTELFAWYLNVSVQRHVIYHSTAPSQNCERFPLIIRISFYK